MELFKTFQTLNESELGLNLSSNCVVNLLSLSCNKTGTVLIQVFHNVLWDYKNLL
jgi:hypothetical protein